MTGRRKDPAEEPRHTRTRSTDTISSIALEITADLAAMKQEIGTLLDEDAEHNVKHALLNRVFALQGAIDLIASMVESCEFAPQCPLIPVVDRFASPEEPPNEQP